MPFQSSESLPKEERLTKRSEYLAVREDSMGLHSRSFILAYRNNDRPWSRLGITVTTKVGTAVVRNRIKRRAREFFRRNRQLFPAGYDLVVIARLAAASMDHAAADAELRRLAERMKREAERGPKRSETPAGRGP